MSKEGFLFSISHWKIRSYVPIMSKRMHGKPTKSVSKFASK